MVASAFRAVFPHSECDVCFVMIFIAHLSKNFLKFFEKTCQECVSEDIYRVKGIRVWVPAQATRRGLPCAAGLFPPAAQGSSLSLPKKSFGISLRSESQIEF